MKRVGLILILLLASGVAMAQSPKILITANRPVADLVYTLGGKLGRNQDVNNAAIISAALADRTKGVVSLPAGIIEITEPIIWPSRTGGMLVGAGPNAVYGDASFAGGAAGGSSTRLVARFNTTNQPMIQYNGIGGRINGISFESYPMKGGTQVNAFSSATYATPIVCTTQHTHDLADGDQVNIFGVQGNTNANGTRYVDVLSSTTFALYSDSGLTTAVAGNGTFSALSGQLSTGWRPVKRAQIGIHVTTAATTFMPTGKINIQNCSFLDLPVGILFGKSMDGAYEMKDDVTPYDGHTAAHADESEVRDCWFRYPFELPSGETRTCLYFRTVQAINFVLGPLKLGGTATEFLYFERGGEAVCDLHINGDCTHVLRTGRTNYNGTNIDCRMTIDGNTSGSGVGYQTSPLRMDQGNGGQHIKISGGIKTAASTVTAVRKPQFVIIGSSDVTIEDWNGLVADGIQLVGRSGGSTRNPALVNLVNCTAFYVNEFEDLFDTAGDNASVTPYLADWTRCKAASVNAGGNLLNIQPIAAGALNSLGDVPIGGADE